MNFTGASQVLLTPSLGWLEGARDGYFPSPRWLGSDKTPAGRLSSGKITSPGGRPCKEQHALIYFRMVLFLSPAGNMRGFFLDIHWVGLVELLVVKHTKLCCRGCDGASLEFVTLSHVHTETPAIRQSQFRFSYHSVASCRGFYPGFFVLVGCDSLYLPVSSIFRPMVCPMTSFL